VEIAVATIYIFTLQLSVFWGCKKRLPTAFEPVLILFTPGNQPVLLCGPETLGYAQEVGSISEIRVLKEFAAENEDYPFIKITPLRNVAKELRYTHSKNVRMHSKHPAVFASLERRNRIE